MVQPSFCSFLFLVTQHNVSKHYPRNYMYLHMIPFAICAVCHCIYLSIFLVVNFQVAPLSAARSSAVIGSPICFLMGLCTNFSRAVSGMELIGHREYACCISLIASRLLSSITVPLCIPTAVETEFLPLQAPALSFVMIRFYNFDYSNGAFVACLIALFLVTNKAEYLVIKLLFFLV